MSTVVMDLSPGTNALLTRKDFPLKTPQVFQKGNQSEIICSAAQVNIATLLHKLILTSQKREWTYKSPHLHTGTYIGAFGQ